MCLFGMWRARSRAAAGALTAMKTIYTPVNRRIFVLFFSNINRSYAPYKKSARIFSNPADED